MRVLNAATVSRLPHYHQILKALQERGRVYVSSEHIARLLKVDPSLVRKDLALVASGVQKVGYHIPSALLRIGEILGTGNTKEAFLIGAGSLGRALMGYDGFNQYGLRILAAFDSDPEKVGTRVRGIEILPMSKLESLVTRMNIRLAILAVPASAAQDLCEIITKAGIRAVWNFAPVALTVPPQVLLRNENLAAGFALLSYEFEKALRAENVSLPVIPRDDIDRDSEEKPGE